jgi:peptidoglycan lytic transglycosylase
MRRFSADINAATRKPDRFREKNKVRRDAFTQGHASTKRISMKRVVFVITGLVLLPSFACADQQVRAAWYCNELRGHRTASGEMFNPDGLTAAHKTLPLGTCLVAGNPKTGKTVVVRVKDRGPFTPGLTLDLSSGAARAIDMRSTESVTMRRC